jgi:alkanesulfonate monooxygenase SsuD/methylene tetrahydromethanopterin reductase-like flavin-dependent oxidoreductase (luciferase family)
MSQQQMRIGMSLRGHGYHLAAWRHPDVPADASVRLDHYIHTAQTAERGKCDLIFFADGLGIRERDVPRGALARQGRDIVDLDPLTLLPALALVTPFGQNIQTHCSSIGYQLAMSHVAS